MLVTKTLLIAGEGGFFTTPRWPARRDAARVTTRPRATSSVRCTCRRRNRDRQSTYMLNGKRYIVVPISGGNYSGEFLAFTVGEL